MCRWLSSGIIFMLGIWLYCTSFAQNHQNIIHIVHIKKLVPYVPVVDNSHLTSGVLGYLVVLENSHCILPSSRCWSLFLANLSAVVEMINKKNCMINKMQWFSVSSTLFHYSLDSIYYNFQDNPLQTELVFYPILLAF